MTQVNEPSANGRPHVSLANDDVLAGDNGDLVSSTEFEDQFGETILQSLDVDQWRLGADLDQEYQRIEREVREAEKVETEKEKQIRDEFFPQMATWENMPKNAGKHETTAEDISAVHRGLLFNGGVEACDGTIQVHETTALTIYQLGVSLVSYSGNQGTAGQRIFRHDLRQKGVEVEKLIDFLKRRAQRDASAQAPGQDRFSELVQKAMLDYAERAILMRRSKSAWRLGHGNPLTYELLTGGNNLDLMVAATRLIREMVEVQQRFVFVAGEPREAFLRTIGRALRPTEFAIIGTLGERLDTWLHQERYKIGVSKKLAWDDEWITPAQWIPRVIERVASKIVVGLFRPTLFSPARTFYAHIDHSDIAAHIALADSMLKEAGTSMLLEMAQKVCSTVFAESLGALAESAYAAVGAHERFFNGRLQNIH